MSTRTRWGQLRRGRALLALAVVAVTVPAVQHASATAPSSPCTYSFSAPTGDAPQLYYGGPNAPALDITRASMTVTRTAVTSVITVAALPAVPTAQLGDYFEFDLIGDATHQVDFGYWRSDRSGGGPSVFGSKTPILTDAYGDPTVERSAVDNSVVTTFDVKNSQVVTTVPRTNLEDALGQPLSQFTPTLIGARSFTVDPAPSYRPRTVDGNAFSKTLFSFAACDRYLSSQRQPAKQPSVPCVVDVDARTGDEDSVIETLPQVDVRDDSLDITHVRYQVTAKNLITTLTIARLSDHPVVGTGQGYFAKFSVEGKFLFVGAFRDSRAGTKPAATYASTTVTPAPAVAMTFDQSQHVTLTMSRAAVAKAIGLTDSRRLVLSSLGGITDFRADGSAVSFIDRHALDPSSVLSFRACDVSLASKHT